MLDPSIDWKGSQTKSSSKQKLALTTWLNKVDFIETYRSYYSQGGKFNWKNSKTQTRIDQIWISKDLKLGLQKSDIESMELVISSYYFTDTQLSNMLIHWQSFHWQAYIKDNQFTDIHFTNKFILLTSLF
jgi:hypothetical protein